MPVATAAVHELHDGHLAGGRPCPAAPSFDYSSSVYQSSCTADLGALANGPPTTSNLGDHVVMSFNGQNYGPSAASNVVLTDTIPPNFRIDSISNPTECAVTGNTVTCQRATLHRVLRDGCLPHRGGARAWSNTATITSATPEAAPDTRPTRGRRRARWPALVHAADHATFTAGAAGTFTVMVAGQGPPTLSATGPLPSGLTFSTTATVARSAWHRRRITSVNPARDGVSITDVLSVRNQTFDIRGSGFASGARATVTGVPNANQRTMFVDSTHLTLTISRIPAGALIGPHDVTVTNPGTAGLRATCAGCLILDPRPTLTSAAPAALPQRSTANVVLTGTGFTTGAVVSFGSGVTVNAPPSVGAGGTSLTVNVTIASNAVSVVAR